MKDTLIKLVGELFNPDELKDFKIESERKNGNTRVYAEGDVTSIAIGLAVMEKAILKEIHMDEDLFDMVKAITGYKEEE